jgi:hypothetical protein
LRRRARPQQSIGHCVQGIRQPYECFKAHTLNRRLDLLQIAKLEVRDFGHHLLSQAQSQSSSTDVRSKGAE